MKKRMDYLDVAKGIAIFLVMMGHAALAFDTPNWRLTIYSFHMPLFFLVSGVVVGRAKDGWRPFLKKNVLTLLVPYLIWALIFLPFKFESLPWVLYGSWAALDRIGTNTISRRRSLFCGRSSRWRRVRAGSMPRSGISYCGRGSTDVSRQKNLTSWWRRSAVSSDVFVFLLAKTPG